MTNVVNTEAQVTVWLGHDDKPLHDGRAIEYIVTIEDGKPSLYQRTSYEDGKVLTTTSSTNVYALPPYVRDAVESQMVPKTWSK
jgi:hypothetical protein